MTTIEQALDTGLAALDIHAPSAISRLSDYIDHLNRWNRVYNLTAVRDPNAMVSRHILDSLAILPWVRGSRILDVGSGAGLPGIPLAIVQPASQFCLLDSSAKRTRFLVQMVTELELDNVAVIRSRAEQFQTDSLFDCLVVRAFASLTDIIRLAGHLCHPGGNILAMKGRYPETELQTLPNSYRVTLIQRLCVPGLTSERHLVKLTPTSGNG